MNLRHAAALALVGWYLMVPPLDRQSPDEFNADAPLGHWQTIGSYDTASECEDTAARLVKNNEKDSLKHERLLHGSCVASDDPRLAK